MWMFVSSRIVYLLWSVHRKVSEWIDCLLNGKTADRWSHWTVTTSRTWPDWTPHQFGWCRQSQRSTPESWSIPERSKRKSTKQTDILCIFLVSWTISVFCPSFLCTQWSQSSVGKRLTNWRTTIWPQSPFGDVSGRSCSPNKSDDTHRRPAIEWVSSPNQGDIVENAFWWSAIGSLVLKFNALSKECVYCAATTVKICLH